MSLVMGLFVYPAWNLLHFQNLWFDVFISEKFSAIMFLDTVSASFLLLSLYYSITHGYDFPSVSSLSQPSSAFSILSLPVLHFGWLPLSYLPVHYSFFSCVYFTIKHIYYVINFSVFCVFLNSGFIIYFSFYTFFSLLRFLKILIMTFDLLATFPILPSQL